MKYTRVAAIIAGSVAALGAASPAMASTSGMPTSLNGGIAHAVSETPLLNGGSGDAVKDVADTATGLNNIKGDAPEHVLRTAGELTPLLGGVELGS